MFGPQSLSDGSIFGQKLLWSDYIGMWGIQEFSDDFRQLQPILNHPNGETVQKHHFGGLLEAKKALLGSLVAQKRPDTRPKCVVTIIPAQSDQ